MSFHHPAAWLSIKNQGEKKSQNTNSRPTTNTNSGSNSRPTPNTNSSPKSKSNPK